MRGKGFLASGTRLAQGLMAKSNRLVILTSSRDISFAKLLPSQTNVRCIKAGYSGEEMAEDTARRGLLQNPSVRPVMA